MHRTLRQVTVGMSLALAFATPAAGLLPGGVATASAEEGERRALNARQFETDNSLSDEYARRAEEKRLQSIQFLKELLADPETQGDRKAEMMLRLADMYFQQGRYLYLTEMGAFDEQYDRCFNTEGCNTEGLKPDNAESASWQGKSIKLYQQILSNYPQYQRADEATYYLASALQDTGDRKDAVRYYAKLVKMYPDSQYVPDSFVQIGEYYFDNDNAYQALTAYQKAASFQNSDKYPFALYKLAWCYFNVGEYGKSIDTMKAVVSYSMTAGEETSAARKLQLQDEALKDLVRFFADAGEMDEAYEYFNKLGKKDLIRSMLKRLATMYFEQGKFEQCIQTYRRLIAENPQSPDNPGYQAEIIKAYKKTGQREKTLEEINRMLKTYGKNSAWARANSSNQDVIRDAEGMIETNLRQVAVDYHTDAKKYGTASEAERTWELAENAYTVYLEEFPESSHAYEVRYAFGELLYKRMKFDKAYDQYMTVVKIDPQGKHSRFCAESAIFAAEKMVKAEGGGEISTAKVDANVAAQELSGWEQNLVNACAQYATLYPEDTKVRNVIYKSAYLLYNKFRFEEAADQFKRVILMEPSSREAEQAANLILDSFVVREDWRNLKTNAKFYYDQQGLGSPKFKKEVYNIYERASFKLIEVEFAADKDYAKAADALVAFSEEFPDSEVAGQALNNASVYYHQVNRVADAMRIRHILVEDARFGAKSKYYYDQVGSLGYDYETIADFGKAAHYYEMLFGLYPEQYKKVKAEDEAAATQLRQVAKDALYSAALYRKAQGDWQGAIEDYKQFVAAFDDDDRVNDVKLAIGRTYEEQEQWAQAANVYYGFYTKASSETPLDFTYFARLHYGKMLAKQNQKAKAVKVYEETVKLYEGFVKGGGQPGVYTEFVAEMMYDLAEPKYEAFAALQITGGPPGASRKAEDKAMETSLKAKTKALVEMEQTYSAIIGTGAGEWGLAGVVKLGQVYENMGEALTNAHVPSYLTADQRDIYTMAIEDKVYPLTEKAVAAYTLALDKSYGLTLYNDNTAFATRRLGKLRPNDFPGLEEELITPRYTAQQSRSFSFEPSL
ncbi:MAG: tetratricopeptide repeat protein [Deltaproteobacteria bacterium]|nr:tetratricopeptide repeat protein [Deltaproteobacteria bacterium]